MSAAIAFTDVSAGYHDNVVLKNLTFEIQEGEIAAVIGPNGSGKTTLLRSITGLVRPSTGSIGIFGRPNLHLPAAQRARLVGVVPQEMETPMAFTVSEVVTMGRTSILSRWRQPTKEDRQAVEQAMLYTDVREMRHRPFSELSGGEKKRVVIAMALAQEPRIVLMDEATSHLDMNHRLEVMQIVERMNREDGLTVLMVSHDLSLAADFCKRLLLMNHGSLLSDGPPEAVLNEDDLKRVYNCNVRVRRDLETDVMMVMPVREGRRVAPLDSSRRL